mmetsp:Transcript_6310/g.23775  ORF Transcript_6310/g.23775 Transcript_6310/m.23775 type:complete len:950 (-) Transcript_6310:679-3528(-)
MLGASWATRFKPGITCPVNSMFGQPLIDKRSLFNFPHNMTSSTPHHPQQSTQNDTFSKASGSEAKSKETDAISTSYVVDESDFEILAAHASRSLFCSCFKSLRFTLLFLIMCVVAILLIVCIAWGITFGVTVGNFGEIIRKNTFREMSGIVTARFDAMSTMTDAVVSSGHLRDSNTPFDDFFRFGSDVFENAKRRFGPLTVILSSDNSTNPSSSSSIALTSMPAVQIASVSNIPPITPVGFQQFFLYNQSARALGTPRFGFPSTPMTRDYVQFLESHPRHFSQMSTFSCVQADNRCGALVLKYRSYYLKNGALKNGLTVDFAVTDLSTMLDSISRDDAMAFIIQRKNQRLVAVSKLDKLAAEDPAKYQLFEFVGTTDNAVLKRAADYPEENIQSITKHLQTEFGDDLIGLTSEDIVSFTYGSQNVDVQVLRLPGYNADIETENNLNDVVLVHTLPTTAFTQSAINVGVAMGCITVVVAVTALVMVCCITMCISRPLAQLSKQMNHAVDLQFHLINTKKFTYFTEIRKLQYMFYFLNQSMKQIRAFLPAHLLQTIDAKLEKDKSLKSRKGKHNKINPGAATTVEDELASESSYEDDQSDNRSFFSKSIASGKSRRSHHQFQIGMIRRVITVVEVQLVGLENILRTTSLEDFTNQHSLLVETVNQAVVTTKGATFSNFDHDRFVISINSTLSCRDNHEKQGIILAMKLKNRLERCNERFVRDSLSVLPFIIGVSTGQALVSVIGTVMMKNQSIHGYPVLLNRVMRDSVIVSFSEKQQSTLFQDGGVLVLMDGATKEKVPSHLIQCRQVNLLNVEHGHVSQQVSVFELQQLVSNKPNKEKEWLYTMQDDIRAKDQLKCNQVLTTSWAMLLRDEAHEAVEFLEEHLSSDKTSTQVFQQCLLRLAAYIDREHDGDFKSYIEKELSGVELSKHVEEMKWSCALRSFGDDEEEEVS